MDILFTKVINATCTNYCIQISFRCNFFYFIIITPQIFKSITYDIPADFDINLQNSMQNIQIVHTTH